MEYGPTNDERDARLSEGAAALAGRGRHPVLRNPHLLLAVAATLMTAGIVLILLAWLGIARSTMVEEQLAYLVSGGVLGLALATIGALTFFSHWLTVLISTNREQTELLREVRDHQLAREHEEAPPPRRPARRAPRRS
jgi:hypothetical protein